MGALQSRVHIEQCCRQNTVAWYDDYSAEVDISQFFIQKIISSSLKEINLIAASCIPYFSTMTYVLLYVINDSGGFSEKQICLDPAKPKNGNGQACRNCLAHDVRNAMKVC